jgi:hypothetical protein
MRERDDPATAGKRERVATICRNTVNWRGSSATFERVTLPTASQRRALVLLGVTLEAVE